MNWVLCVEMSHTKISINEVKKEDDKEKYIQVDRVIVAEMIPVLQTELSIYPVETKL